MVDGSLKVGNFYALTYSVFSGLVTYKFYGKGRDCNIQRCMILKVTAVTYYFPFSNNILVKQTTQSCKLATKFYILKYTCDPISHNQASSHTKSNLRFYQKWIAGLIHYHIPHCASFRTGKSDFCSSFLPTLSKPRVGDWCH